MFSHSTAEGTLIDRTAGPTHAALVLLRFPDSLDGETLAGVARTLSQLSQLGLHSVIIIETSLTSRALISPPKNRSWRQKLLSEVDRVVDAIEQSIGQKARRLDSVLSLRSLKAAARQPAEVRDDVQISSQEALLRPLHSGEIPVVAPICSTADQKLVPADASGVLLAIARDLTGKASHPASSDRPFPENVSPSKSIALDRVIILDPKGGIPPSGPNNRAHVFINLEQEFERITEDLKKNEESTFTNDNITVHGRGSRADHPKLHLVTGSNGWHQSFNGSADRSSHLSNLQLVKGCLALLPATSSALIASPQAVARFDSKIHPASPPGVGTRSRRNILIHNLLTDKPVFSSSLPISRRSDSLASESTISSSLPTTFIKRGMPLTILPDAQVHSWKPPSPDSPLFSLADSRLDIPRLVHLIEDSFGRPLDQEKYFKRIASNLAGVIIAGSYEGCAILTWERPPDAPEGDSSRLVPYLDKFAVLKRSQGAGGVADIVFSAMVRECFPDGVCWRSRSDNPVNKWYFERARGSWRLDGLKDLDGESDGLNEGEAGKRKKGQSWTVFWTTEKVSGQLWADYEGVCRSIGTCWADGKRTLD